MTKPILTLNIKWCFSRYEGPISGVGIVNEKLCYFNVTEESSDGEWFRKYDIRQFSHKNMLYERIKRCCFNILVVKSPHDWCMFCFYHIFKNREEKYKTAELIGQYVK